MDGTDGSLGPLRFERRFLEKPWGGRALERTPGLVLPPDAPIGETWEVVDREGENSVVAEGPFQGRTLGELVRERGRELLGKIPPTPGGRFPLLVKYIDASQNLSVQVHPDDETATSLGAGAEGKTEAWYVLDVAPEGVLYAGLDPEVERATFEQTAGGPGVVEALSRWDVRPGDCMLVPGGTVHAIGAGVTLLEVQQNSDTTYRLWDWGRVGLDGKPRDTHVPEALACARFQATPRPPVAPEWEEVATGLARAPLARSRHFGMNALRLTARRRLSTGSQFQIYAVVSGEGRLTAGSSDVEWRLSQGDVWLVPAACGFHWIEPRTDRLLLVQMLSKP